MISFKYKGSIKRLTIKTTLTSQKLISAICRLFPIKGFVLGFRSQNDSYYDVDSFILAIELFRNTVVEIVTQSDHNDISFSSDNVSSFAPPQEKSPSAFLGGNRLFQVDNVEEGVNAQVASIIVVFTFEEKIKEWVLGRVTGLANKYATYDIVFLYHVAPVLSKKSSKSSSSPTNTLAPMFKIYTNKTKLCQIKITSSFIQQIQKILLDISLIPLQDNSFVKTLKRIQKLDESPSFITRNIEDVMSKQLIIDNLQQMCQEYIITESELEKLIDLVENNFGEFSELFCKNLGDTDYEAFKKEIEGHLQRYRVLLNSLLEGERPMSRDEQRQNKRRGKQGEEEGRGDVEVLKIEEMLEVLDELDSLAESQHIVLKKLILQENRDILKEIESYQKKQVNQASLVQRLIRAATKIKDEERPLSRCIPRGRNPADLPQQSSPEPNFNFNIFGGNQQCSSEKSFGENEKKTKNIPFLLNENDSFDKGEPQFNRIGNERELQELMAKITLTSYEEQLISKHYGNENPLVQNILRYYISIKNTSLESDSAKIQKYLTAQTLQNSLPSANLSWVVKFSILKIFLEEFIGQGRITSRQKDLSLLAFIENKSTIVGAFEFFLAEKNEQQFIDTIKLISVSSLSSNSFFLDTFIFTSKFYLKGIYQHPKLLDYTIANYSSVFRGICEKQSLTLNFQDLIENIDALKIMAFTKRFYLELQKSSIPIMFKQSLIKEFQTGNPELYLKIIALFQSSINPSTLQLSPSFQPQLAQLAKEYGSKDRDHILSILTELATLYNTPALTKVIKYYDSKQPSFCSFYQLYKHDHQKSQYIDNLKIFINLKEPGLLAELPIINESPVLKKRYREKNDEMISIIRLLRTKSEEEVEEKLREFEGKETIKVVGQTLRGLGLTGEKISKIIEANGEEVTKAVLRYLNLGNKEEMIFALEPYLMVLAPENQHKGEKIVLEDQEEEGKKKEEENEGEEKVERII